MEHTPAYTQAAWDGGSATAPDAGLRGAAMQGRGKPCTSD